MRAYRTDGQGSGRVDDIEKPQIDDQEVLIQVETVALNPTDWKSQGRSPAGRVVGCDYCGKIVELGEKAKSAGFKEGDRVAGMTISCKSENNGAFADFVAIHSRQLWHVPDSLSAEDAVAIGGVGSETAAQALFFGDNELRLGLPWPYEGKSDNKLLIWSAASSVGQYAIQLAKFSGLEVVVTASPKNFDTLRQLGADHCFNYSDPDVEQKIAKAHDLTLALDCFGMDETPKRIQHCLGQKGGKIVTLIYQKKEGQGWRDDVTVGATLTVSNSGIRTKYGAWGVRVVGCALRRGSTKAQWIEVNEQDVAYAAKWHKTLPRLIEDQKLRPMKIKRCPGGLDGIAQGLQFMKEGKQSGEKLVFSIDKEFQPKPNAL